MLLKLKHALLETDQGSKFLPIKTYYEVTPRSLWSSLCDWSRELAPFLRKLFKTRTNRELVTHVFPVLKLFTCFCIELSLAAPEIFASSGWSFWLPQFLFQENQSKNALSDTLKCGFGGSHGDHMVLKGNGGGSGVTNRVWREGGLGKLTANYLSMRRDHKNTTEPYKGIRSFYRDTTKSSDSLPSPSDK